jgi:pSer/pThr/pTyr-binding forkhead associated (FHA) protein/outer membrane protein assembly factor BamB
MPKITVTKKAEVIAEYMLSKKSITVGSAKTNDIILVDNAVSEQHCVISKKDGAYELRDNSTLTGTLVNGKQVTIQPLQFLDVVNIGPFSLIFRQTSLEQARKDEPAPVVNQVTRTLAKPFYLLSIYGKYRGKKFELRDGENFIGREAVSPKGIANDIVLSGDMTVSKGHAKINVTRDKTVITDVGSTGGVAVNSKKVGQLNDMDIAAGDEIAIGRSIFRFVAEKMDYSVPRNYGIFLLQIRKPLMVVLTLLVLAVCFYLTTQGISGISVVTKPSGVFKATLNNSWLPERYTPYGKIDEYDISSSAAVGDINSNGTNAIVYLSKSGSLYAWNGKTGKLLWQPAEIFNSGKTSPVLYDMNNDGILDIIVVSDNSMLYIIDGRSGETIYRDMLGGTVSNLAPAVADLDLDGKPDVVVCSEEGNVHFIYAPGFPSNTKKFTEFINDKILASPVMIVTKKISPLIVVCSYSGKVYVFDGSSRSQKTVDLVEKTGKAHLIAGAPAVGDLNGDGVPEIVVQTNVPQYVTAVDIQNFNVKWSYFIEPVPPTDLKHNSTPVLTDVNGDGMDDVIVLSANGFAYALKGETGYPGGEMLWKVKVPDGGRVISAASAYDFDKDGLLDLVFGSESGTLFLLKNGETANKVTIMPIANLEDKPVTSSTLLADLGKTGKVDIIATNLAGEIKVIETNTRTFKGKVIWPEFLGSFMNSGGLENKESVEPSVFKIFLAFCLFVIFITLRFIIVRRALSKRPKVIYL